MTTSSFLTMSMLIYCCHDKVKVREDLNLSGCRWKIIASLCFVIFAAFCMYKTSSVSFQDAFLGRKSLDRCPVGASVDARKMF